MFSLGTGLWPLKELFLKFADGCGYIRDNFDSFAIYLPGNYLRFVTVRF